MRVRRHLQTDDPRGIDIDDDALNLEDLVVAGQRILPRFELRMADGGVHQIHLADAAAVVLKCRDLFRIRRPEQNRPIAAGPAGVVGCVAKIFHAVLRELRLLAGGRHREPTD